MATILGAHKNLKVIPIETGLFRDKTDSNLSVLSSAQYGENILGVVEKTPAHMHYLDVIRERVSNVKFIMMVREPYDMIASQKHRDGTLDEAYAHILKDLAQSIEVSKRNDVIVVRYEDLITDLEAKCREVCTFIQLPFDPQMLKYYEVQQNWWGLQDPKAMDGRGWVSHRHRRAWQVRQPIFDGRGRRTELTQEEIDSFLPVATHYAETFGYLP